MIPYIHCVTLKCSLITLNWKMDYWCANSAVCDETQNCATQTSFESSMMLGIVLVQFAVWMGGP